MTNEPDKFRTSCGFDKYRLLPYIAVLARYVDIFILHAHLPAFSLVTFSPGVLLSVFQCSFLYDELFYSILIDSVEC